MPLQYFDKKISFYRNIVRQNVSCELGLKFNLQFFIGHLDHASLNKFCPTIVNRELMN